MHAQPEGTKSAGSATPTPGDGAANIDQATGTELSEFVSKKLALCLVLKLVVVLGIV